jgi:hypothetical protein
MYSVLSVRTHILTTKVRLISEQKALGKHQKFGCLSDRPMTVHPKILRDGLGTARDGLYRFWQCVSLVALMS